MISARVDVPEVTPVLQSAAAPQSTWLTSQTMRPHDDGVEAGTPGDGADPGRWTDLVRLGRFFPDHR